MELKLQSCVIRSWSLDDARAVQRYANNRKIWANLRDGFPHPYSVADAEGFLGRVIDEKPTTKQIRIILYAKGHTTEASIADDGTFILPTLDAEWVDVRLVSGKYNLFYERVFLKKLDSDLTFRVFTNRAAFRRLSDTDDKCPPGQSLSSAHDLDFHDGTQMVVTTCK